MSASLFKGLAVALILVSANSATTLTRETGAAVGDNQNSKTAGPNGSVLLEDFHLIEKLARFDRERIPERVVHARGAGAHGEFISYSDFSDLSMAAPFQAKGKKTEVFVRFSSVVHSKDSPETLRDPRGFAVKFYTDEGNWDLVGNNLPVFFIRDAMKFPDMVHSLKPDPRTNQQDPNRFFDFFAFHPESTHMLTVLYSDLGTPATYREMDGNGVHAYKFVNKEYDFKYVKFRWLSQQGVRSHTLTDNTKVQGQDFGHMTRDLYQKLDAGIYPSWELQALIMDPSQINSYSFNPLDATIDWYCDMDGIKCLTLGKMTLNRVPDNFFQFSEQSAFSPAVMVPGIEPSEDRLLQGRLFSYSDTQRYRLGVNYQYLPVNRAKSEINTHNQDGSGNFLHTKTSVNYQPNGYDQTSLSREEGIYSQDNRARNSSVMLKGRTQQEAIRKTDHFLQPGEVYRKMSDHEKTNLIKNFAADLGQVKSLEIRAKIVAHAYLSDQDYGRRLAESVNVSLSKVKSVAEMVKRQK